MDKERLQETKGGLLRDLYNWILQNDQFLHFLDDPIKNILWIRGDPGKGKTMLMCGIIDELQDSFGHSVVYFFCQETDINLNNAVSVLRGILFLLISQQPLLMPYLQAEYDKQGVKLFEGNNVWVCLKGIFEKMSQSSHWENIVIVVDALDECITGQDQLLDMIMHLTTSTKIKWIISSRNSTDIEDQLHKSKEHTQLKLESNHILISKAVELFIEQKTRKLAVAKRYSNQMEDTVRDYLSKHSNGTFLWVALVCAELAKVHEWDVIDTLRTFPSDLQNLYTKMMERIFISKSAEICKDILATAILAYEPLHLTQLKVLTKSVHEFRIQQLKNYYWALWFIFNDPRRYCILYTPVRQRLLISKYLEAHLSVRCCQKTLGHFFKVNGSSYKKARAKSLPNPTPGFFDQCNIPTKPGSST